MRMREGRDDSDQTIPNEVRIFKMISFSTQNHHRNMKKKCFSCSPTSIEIEELSEQKSHPIKFCT